MDRLRRLGVRHLRFGTGDLRLVVQHASARRQSLAMRDDDMALARHARFDSVQIDLVDRLPPRTERRVRATPHPRLRLGPDRIQGLPLLHQPSRLWTPCASDADAVPATAAGARLWQVVVDALSDAGCARIGSDLFLLDDDALTLTHPRGDLYRSAMGFANVPVQPPMASGCGCGIEVGGQRAVAPRRGSQRSAPGTGPSSQHAVHPGRRCGLAAAAGWRGPGQAVSRGTVTHRTTGQEAP